MVQRRSGLSGQRCGPGRVVVSPWSGSTDRPRSVLLGSGAEAALQQRRSSVFRWRFLAASILHGLGLWRFRSDRSPMWSGFVWWLVVWCRGWLWRDRAVLRRMASARWLVAVWRRFDGDGTCRRRVWLVAARGFCGGEWVLDRANVLGPCWSFLDVFNLVCYCVFTVVSWLKISPPSVERGFGCFRAASMPLLWCLGRFGLVLFGVLLYSQDRNLYLGGQSNGEKLPHMVWRYWVMVLEGVAVFLRLAAGMCVVSWGSKEVVPLTWCFFRGLFGLLSMFSCCQRDCHLFMHVVWLVWDTVLLVDRWLFVMLDAGSYRDSRKWSHIVARGEGVWWLEFRSFDLMVSVTAVSWGFSGVVRDSSFIRPVDEDGVAACHTRTL